MKCYDLINLICTWIFIMFSLIYAMWNISLVFFFFFKESLRCYENCIWVLIPRVLGTREGRPGILCSERVFDVKSMKPGLSFKNLILLTAWPKRPMPSQTCAEFVTGIQSPVYNSCSFLLMRLHLWPDLLGFVFGQNYLRISVMPLSKNVALGQSLYTVVFFSSLR